MTPRQLVLTLVSLTALIAAVSGLYLWLARPEPALSAGTRLPEPRPVAQFELIDQHGRPFTREALESRWSLVFLGFTHCPDICPLTLAQLKELDTRLEAAGRAVQTVFVSADPARDTPEALARYLGHFDPQFVGATGEKGEIDKLCSSLGLGYVVNPGPGAEYTVDHSAALVLIDPQARAAAYFQPPHDPERLAADLLKLVGESVVPQFQ